MSQRDLEGRTALITGASSGMGFASARSLAARGAKVAIASRGEAKLERAKNALLADGIEVEAYVVDVRQADSLRRVVAATERDLGPIDILVANGGGPRPKTAADLTDDDFDEAYRLCFLFVPRLCRLVLDGMRTRRWGRIVAINSVSARQPIPSLALSNTFRPAVIGYLKTLSQEVAPFGVTVNSVLPGYTRTERQEELARDRAERSGRPAESIIAEWAANAPIERLAEPSEISDVIAFLCSPAASYVTGQAITVDGGYVKGLL